MTAVVDLTASPASRVGWSGGDSVLVPGIVCGDDGRPLGPLVQVSDRVHRGDEVHFESTAVTVDPEFLTLTSALDRLVAASYHPDDPDQLDPEQVAARTDAYTLRLKALTFAADLLEAGDGTDHTPPGVGT